MVGTEIEQRAHSRYLSKTRYYDTRPRFVSFWHQIQEIANSIDNESEGRILEIGPGAEFVTDYLLKQGFSIETLDINEKYKPDYIGSVNDIPIADRSFDVVACFEVLEHLPFEHFSQSLKEMARVARRQVLLSVPDVRYFAEIDLSFITRHFHLHALLSFPRLIKGNQAKSHFWEIGRPGYPLTKILHSFPPELRLKTSYRIPGNPYHHMFVCDVVIN